MSLEQVARDLAAKTKNESIGPGVNLGISLLWGTVIGNGVGYVDLDLDNDGVVDVPNVSKLASYTATNGDKVRILVIGPEWLVLGKIG